MAQTGNTPLNMFSNHYVVDNLPPRHGSKAVKLSEKWQMAMLDAFENEAISQWKDNLEFTDLYRMVEGKVTYQELSEIAPHMKDLESLLDGAGIPSFLKHYDIIGIVINAIIGYYTSVRPKFNVTDTGEIATNEYLRHKSDEFQKKVKEIIQNEVDMHLAQNGFDPSKQTQFESEEEQQAYVQQLEQAKQKFTPKDAQSTSGETFKTNGIKWGQATLQKDEQMFNFLRMERKELKDQLISGRCFRHFRIGYDDYEPETWSAKNTFFSREVEAELVHKGEYAGRLNFATPAELVRRYGHEMSAHSQKELLGGNKNWANFATTSGGFSNSLEGAVKSDFGKIAQVPFSNFEDYEFSLALEDNTGIPMGVQTYFNKDGSETVSERFLPRQMGKQHGRFANYASVLRSDFRQRLDLCQVTEVYFRAYDQWGYLTYKDQDGVYQTEEVTEDILPEFLKENNIKQSFKTIYKEVISEFHPDTLQWTLIPVIYEGVKIQASHLSKPIYLYCRPSEHQIKGSSIFEKWLPIAGFIGKSTARKIEPFQAKYNLCMNQIWSLLEKEVGVFFLLDTAMIPSEYEEWGDSADALTALRNLAKDIGVMPVTTSGEGHKNPSNFNQFSTYNLSYTGQIADRIKLAEFNQSKAYEMIGLNPSILQSPTKYETAEGVKTNQEASFAQLTEIYEDFEFYLKACNEIHLSVAQYCQTNKKDISVEYTKSDGSFVYLSMTDPEFPLRNIGVIPTSNPETRKKFLEYRQHLISTNTIGTDTLELAKLFNSEDMAVAIEIANEAIERRQAEAATNHQREQENIQSKAQFDKQASLDKYEMEENSKQKDRESRIYQEQIKALGRAADKNSDTQGFDEINRKVDIAIKMNAQASKDEETKQKFRLQETQIENNRTQSIDRLKLETEKMAERIKDRESKERIAIINKN